MAGPDSSNRAGPSRTKKRSVSSTPSRDPRSKRARTFDVHDTTASSLHTRPKTHRKRSLKGKEKAVSSDEDEDVNMEKGVPPVIDESRETGEGAMAGASQTSSPLSSAPPSPTPFIATGNSSSATSLESTESALARAEKELSHKNELLKKHSATITALQSVLQCQICLDLLFRPYSLSPCGHVVCETCLVSWFSQPGEFEQQMNLPLLVPHMKKKTCPTCRTEVRTRPTVAYLVKSTLDTLLPSLDPETYDQKASQAQAAHEDPFKALFPPDLSAGQQRRRDNILGAHPDVIIDEEDGGVGRCPRCLHEIFDGVCTGCGHLYDGVDGDLIDSDLDDGDLPRNGWLYGAHLSDEEDEDEDDEPYESDFIDDGPQGGEGANAEGAIPVYPLGLSDSSDDDDPPRVPLRDRLFPGDIPGDRAQWHVPSPPPSARRMPPLPNRTIVITSSEEEDSASDDSNWQAYLRRQGRRHGSDGSSPIASTSTSRARRGGAAAAAHSARGSGEGSSRAPIALSDDDESDWAPRPRHERLASEERRRNAEAEAEDQARTQRQDSPIVIDDDEDDREEPVIPPYISVSDDDDDEDDAIRPPWAVGRHYASSASGRAPQNDAEDEVSDSGDESDRSDDDVFEDAASASVLTTTSAGRQSSRYHSGAPSLVTSDADDDDDDAGPTPTTRHARYPHTRRPRHVWRVEDDEDDTEGEAALGAALAEDDSDLDDVVHRYQLDEEVDESHSDHESSELSDESDVSSDDSL